jgi:hypothetical protein
VDRYGCNIDIMKADGRGEFVRGWAYVVADEGGQVVDYSGDVLGGLTVEEGISEIKKMAHEFICDFRQARVIHKGKVIGEVTESVVIDDAFAEALGVTSKRRGWWIGMQVHDAEVQKRVRSGELKQFSIGGKGQRTPIARMAA